MMVTVRTVNSDMADLNAAKRLLINQSVLVPIHLIPESRIDAIRQAALDRLLITAHRGLPGSKLTIRDLIPTDVGLTNETWFELTGGSANTWEDSAIAAKTISDSRFVCIWGVTDNSVTPAVAAIRFRVSGSEVARWHLDKLNNLDHRTAIALSPIIISQAMDLTIQHYVKVASAGTDLVFEGAVCEKEGLTIRA